MASSASGSGDKDATSNDKQSNPNNPFIQFRQFADTQISTLLQGIIGLPSALSKRSQDDPRWAGIDDGLRRRDELQERQRELRESEARKLCRQTSKEEEPYAHTGNRSYFSDEDYVPLGKRTENQGVPATDLPLYSAVSRSLFTHLLGHEADGADWVDTEDPPVRHESSFPPFPSKSRNYHSTNRFEQSDIEATYYLVYNDLSADTSLHSEYSLLPYLIFSPYSPLRLSSSQSDNLSYCDAFEDLIATSHPVSKVTPWKQTVSAMIGSRMNGPRDHMRWIEKLRGLGYLQEKKSVATMKEFHQFSMPLMILQELKELEHQVRARAWSQDPEQASSAHSSELSSSRKDVADAGPETEQEMYEGLGKYLLMDALEASLEDDEMSERRREEEEDDAPRSPSIMEEIIQMTKSFLELSHSQNPPSKVAQYNFPSKEVQSESSDPVVSSSTTTECTVREDGTVLTTVTVWKKFGSGREVSSTTHHSENPAMTADAQGEQRGDRPRVSGDKREEHENSKKNGGSGWFWN
ncbi:hypothetical protein VTL71DRAFT_5776 [Oculimacula yallundae]|uniref:Uncharacterized protein n=1 Tax=Oculimacula yallundae TaxID=86028 RepID=A0ABR4C056_9HELO